MKEFLKTVQKVFLIVTVGALFSMALMRTILTKDAMTDTLISIEELWRILAIGAYSALTSFILYSSKELTFYQMLKRKVVQFIVLVMGLIYFAVSWEWILFKGHLFQTVLFLGSVVIIYTLVMILEFRKDKQTTEILNEKLKEYKSKKP